MEPQEDGTTTSHEGILRAQAGAVHWLPRFGDLKGERTRASLQPSTPATLHSAGKSDWKSKTGSGPSTDT